MQPTTGDYVVGVGRLSQRLVFLKDKTVVLRTDMWSSERGPIEIGLTCSKQKWKK